MTNRTTLAILVLIIFSTLLSCQSVKKTMDPARKFSAEAIRKDYNVLRSLLEKYHPALYWYTPKDSMDYYFDRYYHAIDDSMTRQQFGFRILAPLTTRIRCGHTSFNYPKSYNRLQQKRLSSSFPLYLKIWPDTMVVIKNLNSRDSVLTRGTIINRVNYRDVNQLTDTLFQFMPADGYAENINYIRLSAALPYYYQNILGLSDRYEIEYTDSSGELLTTVVPVFNPETDSTAKAVLQKMKDERHATLARKRKRDELRTFVIDSSGLYALMTINGFGEKGHLPSFYRKRFRQLRKLKIPNLVIDIRTNGGGKVNNYTALTRYIIDSSFKVSDTVTAMRNRLGRDKRYFSSGWILSPILFFTTSKKEDNQYHFRYWEKHVIQPRRRNHYNGQVYILINGPTFSASTLFAQTVKGQHNVLLVGEEAGGGAYGNSGMLIPDVILPETKMRVRLPLFRLIQFRHPETKGRGVVPDIYVPPTVENVKKNIDGKMEAVIEMINRSSSNR